MTQEAEQIMKRCQAGTRNYEEANNLHAACYGMIGKLLAQTQEPPQRTWVGLTNNELQPIADEYRILFGGWVEDFARAIEAKLKEKNI